MKPAQKPRRRYRSERRREQAASTRSAIMDAARRLFSERGYAGTSIEAIAEAAGVAAVTVYSAFGSKRALLARLIEVAVVGDERPVPLLQRPGPRRVLAATDQRTQVRLFAHGVARIVERVAPLLEVLGQAARSEPDLAELQTRVLRERLEAMRAFTSALRRNGPLRDEISAQRAAETVWAVTSAELRLLLARGLGWSLDDYASWLERSLTVLLLPPPAKRPARGEG